MKMHQIDLPAVIDQQEAQRLYDTLLETINSSIHLQIDASAVDRMGTSAVQVLVSLSQHLDNEGGSLKIKKPSDAFKSVFTDLGLANFIKEWGAK